MFADMKSVGIGVIVRDWHGHFVAAMCKKLHAPLGPLEAESKTVEVGMKFAKQLGLSDIIMEGDSLMVYRALNQSSSPSASIDAQSMPRA
nr:hypothetical protein CFP56_79129 [Quercus suber]